MKKILVLEDEPDMRRNLATILRLEKFVVVSAENGRAGLDLIAREHPDLILCDVMMPEMDGHALLSQVRADKATATIPFIFLTARGERADLRSGMNMGADDYLTKPVDKTELLAAITARLKRKEEQSTNRFAPNFESYEPLVKLGLTPRAAETLLWVAQGKTNPEIATILGISEGTVKKHVLDIFANLQVETRTAATLRALEVLR
jgi:DNA-binding NarL/FixJ family response regulator